MRYITFAIEAGPAYDPTDQSLTPQEHAQRQEARRNTIHANLAAKLAELAALKMKGEPMPKAAMGKFPDTTIPILVDTETCNAIAPTDISILEAYKEYLSIPLATMRTHPEIYAKWVMLTGRAIVHPHPHRHFTGMEFYTRLGWWPDMAERFLKPYENERNTTN